MTRLGAAFKNSQDLRVKTFELAGQLFRVRIPLTKEMEAIQERVNQIDEKEAQKRYEKLVEGFDRSIETEGRPLRHRGSICRQPKHRCR